MKTNLRSLSEELSIIEDRFPKLRAIVSKTGRLEKLIGELDICDDEGIYWDTFEIEIVVPKKFPYAIPKVFELSGKILRVNDRHISENGLCCLDMEHELLRIASQGVSLCDFIVDKVYTFFANQLFFDKMGKYANGEYPHGFEGVQYFYSKKLNLNDPVVIIRFLNLILKNQVPGRNDCCPCQSGRKFKTCHLKSLEYLKSISPHRLKEDLKGFINMHRNT